MRLVNFLQITLAHSKLGIPQCVPLTFKAQARRFRLENVAPSCIAHEIAWMSHYSRDPFRLKPFGGYNIYSLSPAFIPVREMNKNSNTMKQSLWGNFNDSVIMENYRKSCFLLYQLRYSVAFES